MRGRRWNKMPYCNRAPPSWRSIENGTRLYARGLVRHRAVTWKCAYTHHKSPEFEPSESCAAWTRAALLPERRIP